MLADRTVGHGCHRWCHCTIFRRFPVLLRLLRRSWGSVDIWGVDCIFQTKAVVSIKESEKIGRVSCSKPVLYRSLSKEREGRLDSILDPIHCTSGPLSAPKQVQSSLHTTVLCFVDFRFTPALCCRALAALDGRHQHHHLLPLGASWSVAWSSETRYQETNSLTILRRN